MLVGVSVGSLMGCFRAPPTWRKTAPLKRPIKRSMSIGAYATCTYLFLVGVLPPKNFVTPKTQRIFHHVIFTLLVILIVCKLILRDPPKVPFKTSITWTCPRLFLPHKVIIALPDKGTK